MVNSFGSLKLCLPYTLQVTVDLACTAIVIDDAIKPSLYINSYWGNSQLLYPVNYLNVWWMFFWTFQSCVFTVCVVVSTWSLTVLYKNYETVWLRWSERLRDKCKSGEGGKGKGRSSHFHDIKAGALTSGCEGGAVGRVRATPQACALCHGPNRWTDSWVDQNKSDIN